MVKKNNKKGFTLVEILGVIVILSLILMIGIPKIIDVIEYAQKRAFYNDVLTMAETAKLHYETEEKEYGMDGKLIFPSYEFFDGKFISEDKMQVKGKLPYSGSIYVTATEDLVNSTMEKTAYVNGSEDVVVNKVVSRNKKWCAIKNYNEKDIRIGKSTDPTFNCQVADEPIVEDKDPCELAKGTITVDGSSKEIYYIDSESDLYKFSESVNSGTNYSGKIVRLRNNLDMSKPLDEIKDQCNNNSITAFHPIGNQNQRFKGTFEGNDKTIKNLTISETGTHIGLFGYVEGHIKDLKLDKASISGGYRVGTLAGTTSGGTIKNISVKDSTVTATSDYAGGVIGFSNSDATGIFVNGVTVTGREVVGGYSGRADYGTLTSAMIDNINLTAVSMAGGVAGTGSCKGYSILVKNGQMNLTDANWITGYHSGLINYGVVVENLDIVSTQKDRTKINSGLGYGVRIDSQEKGIIVSKYSTLNGFVINDNFADGSVVNDINAYEAVGMDTIIGGDNNNDGYYFDYDENGKVVLKKGSVPAISLEKDSNDYYLIKTEDDWKQAVTKVTNKYKIVNDLNFSNKKYYMLGSYHNNFSGELNGNDKKISNVTIHADKVNYIGTLGHMANKVSNLTIKNANITAGKYVGGLTGATGQTGNYYPHITGVTIDSSNITGSSNNIGGMIGTAYMASADGLIVNNVTVKGNDNVGGLVGKIDYNGVMQDIMIDNINIEANHGVGSVVGYSGSGFKSVLVKNGQIRDLATDYTDYGYFAARSEVIEGGVIENLKIIVNGSATQQSYYDPCDLQKRHVSEKTTVNGGVKHSLPFSENTIDDINAYDSGGLDTIIGGDNNDNGFYFDYNDNGKVVLKKGTISFNLEKDSDNYYLIKNESDWKQATTRLSNNYKIINDLNFNNKKYYMLGSEYNPYTGSLNGNDKTINNVTINGDKFKKIAPIGHVVNGRITALNLKNVNVVGYRETGGIIGAAGNTYQAAITGDNITVKGNDYVGGFAGNESYTTVREIALDNINVEGVHTIGGAIGYGQGANLRVDDITDVLIKNGQLFIRYNDSSNPVPGSGYVMGSGNIYRAIVENLKVTVNGGKNISYKASEDTGSSWTHYISELSTHNGVSESYFFNSFYIDNLPYYSGHARLETKYNGDSNNTGYFFDSDPNRNYKVWLVKAYAYTEEPEDTPPTGQGGSSCTVSYGDWQFTCSQYWSGTHGGYQYRVYQGSFSLANGGACTGGLNAVERRKVNYTCN